MSKLVTFLQVLVFILMLLTSGALLAQEDGELQPAAKPVQAQDDDATVRRDIHGQVLTRGKKTAVLGAKVVLMTLGRTEYTDERGRFSFKDVPIGLHRLRISGGGHQTKEFGIRLMENVDQELHLYVDQSSIRLEEVVVRERREAPNVAEQTLSKEEIKSIPGAGNDPVKAVSTLPGVAKTNPIGTVGGLVIRGTSQEESGYYLDGLELPFLFHFGALDFIFNSELVEEVNYLPGGYGVRYGEALGGVVDVKTRRPRDDRIGGVVDLAAYSSKAMVEGPITDKLSFAVAARRSFIDLLFPLVVPKDNRAFTVVPWFWDYQTMLDYKLSLTHKLQFTVFGATDGIGIPEDDSGSDDQDPLNTGTKSIFFTLHQQRLAWIWEPSAAVRNTLSVNNRMAWIDIELTPDTFFNTVINVASVREEYEHQLAHWNRIMVGTDLNLAKINMEMNIIQPPKEGEPEIPSFSNDDLYYVNIDLAYFIGSVYLQDEIDIGKYVRITPGARFSYLSYNHTYYTDPRIFMRFKTSKDSAIKLGLGQYHQFPEGDELSEKLGNPDLEPENSYQVNLGFEYHFPYAISIDVQGFYKHMDNMVAPVDNTRTSDKNYLNTGVGRIYGGELLLRKRMTDWWLGWISYSYTVSRRKNTEESDWRFFDQDVTHNIVVLSSFKIPWGFKLGIKWQYATGVPYTPIETSVYNADTDSFIPIFSETINGERNDDLHQLDVRFDKIWTFNAWELSLYIDVQNVYMQPQPFGYIYSYDYSERESVNFPLIIPSFGISARF